MLKSSGQLSSALCRDSEIQPLCVGGVAERTLLAILATPPETSGERTLKRLELAQKILGFDRVEVANVLDVATYRTNGMNVAGVEAQPWLQSRSLIERRLDECAGVLLGYGVSEPTGPARIHFRNQIDWLWGELKGRASPIWSVEMPPRHPSRWHRLTFKVAPGVPFAEVLPSVLKEVDRGAAASARSGATV